MYNLNVSIVISAHNEEQNIKYILLDIVKQNETGFIIKEVIVLSDASIDRTVEFARTVESEKIKVFDFRDRKGKAGRLNNYFPNFHNDVLVIFDADLRLKDENVVSELVKPFQNDIEMDMVLGHQEPVKPKTFVERMLYEGYWYWRDAKMMLPTEKRLRYVSTGQIRAFSKKYIKQFIFPEGVLGGAEDVYTYYFAVQHKLKFIDAPQAVVLFKLVDNFRDYYKQMSRFMRAGERMSTYYSKDVLKNIEVITNTIRLKALIKRFAISPFYIVCYFVCQLLVKFASLFDSRHKRRHEPWETAVSSKRIWL